MKEILILEKDVNLIEIMKKTIADKSFDLVGVNYHLLSEAKYGESFKMHYDLMILSLDLNKSDDIRFLQILRLNYASCPIIIYSDNSNSSSQTILRNNVYYIGKDEVMNGLGNVLDQVLDFEILRFNYHGKEVNIALKHIEYIMESDEGVEIKTSRNKYNLQLTLKDLAAYTCNRRFYKIANYYINMHFINDIDEEQVILDSINFPLKKHKLQDLKMAYLRYSI